MMLSEFRQRSSNKCKAGAKEEGRRCCFVLSVSCAAPVATKAAPVPAGGEAGGDDAAAAAEDDDGEVAAAAAHVAPAPAMGD